MAEQQKTPTTSTPANTSMKTPNPNDTDKIEETRGTASIKERPDLLLSIDPEDARFVPTGSKSEHMLANLGKKAVAVKVRCSDNTLYRVNPVYMFIASGKVCNVIVNRLPGPPKTDKLVFHYLACSDRNVDYKKLFAEPPCKPEQLKLPMACIARDREDAPSIGSATPPQAN